MRHTAFALIVLTSFSMGGASLAAPQAELDRIVARVNNRIITQSDVRRARTLRLVSDVTSDNATLRELENRMLMLAEVARSPAPAPTTDEALARRRAEWEAALGGQAAGLLAGSSMTEKALQMWFRDDVRIESHLERQFGGIPEAERRREVADWIHRLRQRAGLR
jgi:hypothetical protein